MKVLVTGSRDWTDVAVIRKRLEALPPGTTLVHGDCRGADRLAATVGEELGFEIRAYPAD